MKTLTKIFLTIAIILSFSCLSSAQNAEWVRFRSHDIQFNPEFASFPICTDHIGNIYMSSIELYRTSYSLDFLGDMRLEKYSPSGNALFTKIISGKLTIKEMTVDIAGDVYIAGTFLDSIIIDSKNVIRNTGSGFNLNYFIIKFDKNGNFAWSKNISALYGQYFTVDEIHVSGTRLYAGIRDFDSGGIRIFDLGGNELSFIPQFPVRGISSIIVDNEGSIISAGSCGFGNINFGDTSASAQFSYNAYFAKYNNEGDLLWVRFVEDFTFSEVNLAFDSQNNVYAAGDLFTSVWFGNIRTEGSQWVYDFYLTKIDPSGTFLWVREVPFQSGSITGDAGRAKLNSVAVNNNDEIFFAGRLRGSVNWGGGVTTSASGSNDALLLKYDSEGNILSGKRFGGALSDRSDFIAFDINGNAYLSGNFGMTANFDTITVSGSGQINSYLLKLPYGASNGTVVLSMIIEGFYNPETNEMRIDDNVELSLCSPTPPYNVIEQQNAIIDRTTLTGAFIFNSAPSGDYFLRVRHRNSIETWSSGTIQFQRSGILQYDFTSSSAQAFGGNQLQVDLIPPMFAFYSGDVNQDGVVDANDASLIDNDVFNVGTGYLKTDLTGDAIVDGSDASICDNNASNFVGKITP